MKVPPLQPALGLLTGLAAFVLPAYTASATAPQMTASELYDFCRDRADVTQAACRFFILGAAEGAAMAGGVVTVGGNFCLPVGTTAQEMELVYLRLVEPEFRAFPSDRALPAVSVVVAVLVQQYPCRKG